ncbi:MAG TPA: spore coat protein U domain-containing protein [Sphingopyxis sp.]|nr:spore coat protein U domain-containing protein [Sphingopyxis sp.]
MTYNLYSDAGRTTIIPVGGDVTLDDDGTQQTVSVYARAFGEAGLITGTYTDTMTVVVTL